MLQRPTPGILAVLAGNKDKIGEPPDAKAAQGKELSNCRARPADIKAVSAKGPEKN